MAALDGPALSPLIWCAAALPVALLFALVVSGRLKTPHAAGVVAVVTVVVGVVVFGAGPAVVAVGVGKGVWLATWILLVVWPALLLYRLAASAGMERIGRTLERLLATRVMTVLALAWVLPSFIQGVAGFGTPIAVAAPLLVGLGYPVRKALVLTLVGYHWSVTFGSMGSSFYMAALTTGMEGGDQQLLALRAAILLGINCVVAGGAVVVLDGGWAALRRAAPIVLVVGGAMAGTLIGVAQVVPALASLAAGTAGFVALVGLAVAGRRRAARSVRDGMSETAADVEEVAVSGVGLLSPYLYLLATALPVLAIPASRAVARSLVVVAPDFPATVTGVGWSNAAVTDYTPLAVGAHPGFYLVVACVLGYVTYRRLGLLEAGRWRGVVGAWARSLPKASAPVLLLGVVATLLTDTGMVQVLASGVVEVAGSAYPVAAATIGAVGSFATGSTTTSNALFAGFQQQVAELLGSDPTILVAAQTAGGNVGNAMAPVVILVGLSALDDADELSATLRSTIPAIVVLLAVVTVGTLVMGILAG